MSLNRRETRQILPMFSFLRGKSGKRTLLQLPNATHWSQWRSVFWSFYVDWRHWTHIFNNLEEDFWWETLNRNPQSCLHLPEETRKRESEFTCWQARAARARQMGSATSENFLNAVLAARTEKAAVPFSVPITQGSGFKLAVSNIPLRVGAGRKSWFSIKF